MLFRSVQDRLTIDIDAFAEALKGWTITPLTESGEIIGAVMSRGNEIHVGYGKKPRASIIKHIKLTLHDLLARHGYVVTYVANGNEKGLNFCKRLGFYQLSQDDSKMLLRCDRSNYVR